MKRRRIHVLERSQRVELPPERVFEFFSEARNLEVLTPPWMSFKVTTEGPIEMRPGALIDYRLKVHGLPLRWRTRIEVWEPPVRFVDVQLRGPYSRWEHTHTFQALGENAVLIGDHVRYVLPLGPLGELAYAVIVKRDVQRIFDYREHAVMKALGPVASAS
jgi:ligand-binding SRPBCC domain-containing protein